MKSTDLLSGVIAFWPEGGGIVTEGTIPLLTVVAVGRVLSMHVVSKM